MRKKQISVDWLNLVPGKFIAPITFKICWVTYVKSNDGTSGLAYMTINWVRNSSSCFLRIF